MSAIGISVAMLSPFTEGGALDTARLSAHATRLLHDGADGVTLFGTTGEGASLTAGERAAGLDAVLSAGVPTEAVTFTVYATAAADAVDQVRTGLAHGVQSFLVPPPFYFPDPDDDGLFRWYAELLADTDAAARIILYHIPQVTGIGLSPALIMRLVDAFPGRVRAVKDSSGDWATAEALLKIEDLPVLVGDERLLHRAAALGAAGSITGCANLYPARLKRVYGTAQEDAALSAAVTAVVSCPVMPALKVLMARMLGDPAWETLRPPLTPVTPEQRAMLLDQAVLEPADG
ncbi:dihydrodipicolinate synthase family protein [Psychromarinibacter sp. C21-152]|uniref:Dihydrodipicolinate synthase family protein n=1 Tax=Psychromarinibacter sediminicola TaxID=3033385 RepID=A0AAE3NSW2_9RHOB|nr:dihydrodipicolinate synthase family protein [Psychromarinibacter sediminicola]MDF0601451.1 dihydrodipicolinate synthase family protein [Psychromarinibacter sediminicola]